MEDLDVLVDALVRVSVGINGDKDWLNVEVCILLALFDFVDRRV